MCSTMLVLLFFMTEKATATHGIGGEISITHIVSNAYRVRLVLYRDCAGITLPTTQTINLSPTNSGSTVTLTRTTINEITTLCNSQVSKCSSPSSTVNGVEEHIYEAVHNFSPLPPSIPKYTLTWSGCCRAIGINTLVNSGNQGTTLSTEFSRGIPQVDNTPTFLNPPTSQFCVGQPATLSVNAYDADGDVIRYKLIDALSHFTNTPPVTYVSPFSGINPLASSTPITIDSVTGLLNFTPTTVSRAVVAIQATEYRNGVEIGYVRRDIEVVVANCGGNSVPIITPINNAVVSDGNTYCVSVVVTDIDNDSLEVSALSAIIPPATFTIDSAMAGATYGTFCFTPTVADRGNTFAVSILAKDSVCPIPATAVTTFNITVPNVCAVSLSTTVLPTATGQSTGSATAIFNSGVQPFSYSWSGPNNFSSTADSISGLPVGVYYISATDGNNCAVVDSVTILGGASTLPVRFIDIAATQEAESVLVTFNTADEQNVKHFVIERSLDGMHYEKVGLLLPKGGGAYSFNDNSIIEGWYYYRIKEVSLEGELSYSSVVTVRFGFGNKISIHPTILSDNKLIVDGITNFKNLKFVLLDITGRKVFTTALTNSIVNLPDLNQGNYIVTIAGNGYIIKQARITIK